MHGQASCPHSSSASPEVHQGIESQQVQTRVILKWIFRMQHGCIANQMQVLQMCSAQQSKLVLDLTKKQEVVHEHRMWLGWIPRITQDVVACALIPVWHHSRTGGLESVPERSASFAETACPHNPC